LEALAACGVGCVAMRCAGYDRVDLSTAESLGIVVLRVPAYSPHSVAEHAVALMMALNRQIVKASARVAQGNYALSGLVGFDMHGKTCGIIGTGLIGRCTAAILLGMGCRVLAYDPFPNQTARDMGIEYVELEELLASSRVISLHCPLTDETRHLINKDTISLLKPGAMIINTSRGGLLDTAAAVEGLDSRKIGALGMDVYEEEGGLFFTDSSIASDDLAGASTPEDWDPAIRPLLARPASNYTVL